MQIASSKMFIPSVSLLPHAFADIPYEPDAYSSVRAMGMEG
jgi:hypothetical protein